MSEADAIESLRKKVLAQIEANNENDNVESSDILLLKNTNDMLWRYLLHDLDLNDKVIDKHDLNQVNYDNSCKLLIDTLKWRKQFGLHKLTNSHFPIEFYRMNMFSLTHLVESKRIFLFIRVCKYINISANVREFIIKAIFFEIEKRVIAISPLYPHGLCDLKPIVVLDCGDISYQAMDVQLLITVLNIVAQHYPQLIYEFWIYRLPWIAKYLVPVLLKAIPRSVAKVIYQVSQKEALKRVDPRLLPKFMDGTCPIQPHLDIPSDAGQLDQVVERFAFKQSEVDKFKRHLATLSDD